VQSASGRQDTGDREEKQKKEERVIIETERMKAGK
jgi:hypothetical protein